jgi:hypothetical protein
VVIDPTKSPMNYNNSVFLFSYAKKVLNNLSLGTNLKFFSAKLEGGPITDGNATGMQLDLGTLYHASENLDLSATLQNALPSDLGGKLTYAGSGQEETYPSILKVGTKAKLGDLSLLADADLYLNRKNSPTIFHLGGEYQLNQFACLRAGLDQDIVAGTAVNNLTAGVGLEFNHIRFDYAYHQFAGAPGMDTHFFSLSYGIFEKKPEFKETPKEEIKEAIEIFEPADQSVLF